MGFPGKLKFPIISNYFANCCHKGELSAVFSAIYYLNSKLHTLLRLMRKAAVVSSSSDCGQSCFIKETIVKLSAQML